MFKHSSNRSPASTQPWHGVATEAETGKRGKQLNEMLATLKNCLVVVGVVVVLWQMDPGMFVSRLQCHVTGQFNSI